MRKNNSNINKTNLFTVILPLLTIVVIGSLFAVSLYFEKSWIYDWHGIQSDIKDSIKIAKNEGISSGVIGYGARKPVQFDRRHWIMKNASESELLKLTKYPNGTIKAIAYEGLIRKQDFKNKTELILKAINDQEYPIHYQSGCIGQEMYIGQYLVDFVLLIGENSPPPPPRGSAYKFGISKKDTERIIAEYKKTTTPFQ